MAAATHSDHLSQFNGKLLTVSFERNVNYQIPTFVWGTLTKIHQPHSAISGQ